MTIHLGLFSTDNPYQCGTTCQTQNLTCYNHMMNYFREGRFIRTIADLSHKNQSIACNGSKEWKANSGNDTYCLCVNQGIPQISWSLYIYQIYIYLFNHNHNSQVYQNRLYNKNHSPSSYSWIFLIRMYFWWISSYNNWW